MILSPGAVIDLYHGRKLVNTVVIAERLIAVIASPCGEVSVDAVTFVEASRQLVLTMPVEAWYRSVREEGLTLRVREQLYN